MARLDPTTRRVLAAHALASLALSLPWPLLLVLVDRRVDDPLLLGLAGALRMLPYVALSWAAARLADAGRRDRVVRLSLAVRVLLLAGAAVAVPLGAVGAALAAATLAVAVATPAYPALVAAMPAVAGADRRRATDLLVTVEVAAFVVGAALGGLMLQPLTRPLVPGLAVALTLTALVLVTGVVMPAPVRRTAERREPVRALLRRSPAARCAIAVMAVVNLVASLLALALLPLARDVWSSDASGYGLATGVLGFAALAAPLLRGLGRTPARAVRRGLALLALGVLLLAAAPAVGWALLPLAVVGATAVSVEAAATGVLQDAVDDDVRATVLGLNDSVMIGAALVGSLLAPASVALLGGPVLLGTVAAGTLLAAWWAAPVRATTVPSRVMDSTEKASV